MGSNLRTSIDDPCQSSGCDETVIPLISAPMLPYRLRRNSSQPIEMDHDLDRLAAVIETPERMVLANAVACRVYSPRVAVIARRAQDRNDLGFTHSDADLLPSHSVDA